MKVLITGGAGFIGSTVAAACLDEGIDVVVLDGLSTGRAEFVEGRTWYRGDIADGELVDRTFSDHPDVHAALGCAAKIVVPESVAEPLRAISPRYFNPIGCDSGIRDYVHDHDLARARVAALRRFDAITSGDAGAAPYRPIDPGTGHGTTVFELTRAFENVTGEPLGTEVVGRRPGGNAGAYPDVTLVRELLGREPALSVERGIADPPAWHARRDLALALALALVLAADGND
ncbi:MULTISPECIES: NAD-dependent epimerase/dehydratase family protein [unclassified Streptomyces]|uniref:NAD-dependent epimerase/dehydratase family protein n=1 Tax=unclassified Streptomyces TaxID=2593676 RepID=UPI0033A44265